MATKKLKTSFTNSKGEKVQSFTDGTKTTNGVSNLPTATKQKTTSATDPFSKENLDKLQAARGNEFAPAFEASGGVKKGESITSTLDKRAGQSGGGNAKARAEKLAADQKKAALAAQKADLRKAKREKLGNTSYADKMRAGNTDTTKEESITQKGVRSTKALGSGEPLTDAEVIQLEKEGYREGDFVPGRGILLPDGTFNTSSLTAQNLRAQEKTTAQGAVVSDTPIVREEENAKTKIENASITSPTKAALTLLDEELGRIKDDLRSRESSIKSTYRGAEGELAAKQAGEMGTASVGLAEAGGYLGFSGGAQGVLLSLGQTHRAELADLDVKREAAIQEARDAAANKRYDIVRLKADEIVRIDQETYNRQEDYLERVRKETEKETIKQEKLKTQGSINDVIQYMRSNGSRSFSPEDIYNELNGTVDIAEINDFLTGITPKGDNIFKFSPTQTAGLLGSGMSADDISALNEYVATNGYDEKIKAALTPGQRVAVDKIFKTGAIGTGSGSGFTAQEQRKLEQVGLLEAPRQEQLDYLYGGSDEKPYESIYTGQILDGSTSVENLPLEVQEDVRSELYNLGFGSDVVPQWYRDYIEASESQTLNADNLKSNWTTFRKTALGEAIEEEESSKWWWQD